MKNFFVLKLIGIYLLSFYSIALAGGPEDDDKDGSNNTLVKRMGNGVSGLGNNLYKTQISKLSYRSSGTKNHIGPKNEKLGEEKYNIYLS